MIRKAVIPAAGRGTRMRALTGGAPKEMLLVAGKPVIQYVVEEAVASGLDDIIIVISPGKEAIRKYFARKSFGRARVRFVLQKEPRGLGHAVLQVRTAVGREPFAVLLGDVIIKSRTPLTRQLVRLYQRKRAPVIALKTVPLAAVSRYGIVAGRAERRGVFRITSIVEKPDRADAPSRLAVASRYVFPPGIFALLSRQRPGLGNEIQLTDAIRKLLEGGPAYGLRFRGVRYDIGGPADLHRAEAAISRASFRS